MIKKAALLKLILASCLLSSVICTGITLTAPVSGACTGTILINVRSTAGGADIPACVSSTDPIYTAAKGCGAYVAEGATLANPIAAAGTTATALTCDVGARVEDGSAACATTGYIKVNIKIGTGSPGDSCINPNNPTYLSLASKGCGYYAVDAGTVPVNSLTFTCGGVLVKSVTTPCETGYTKIKVKQVTGSVVDACVNSANPNYLTQLPKGCGYYVVDTGSFPVKSVAYTCTGVGILDASSGCGSGYTKIKVKTSTGSASAFGCVSVTNTAYTRTTPVAEACGFFTLHASATSVTSFPIISDDLTCGGVQVTAVGSGCGTGQTLISVRTSSSGQSTNVCVKDANDLFFAAGTSCQYYLLDSSTNLGTLPANSDTMSCGGLVLKAFVSACAGTEDKISVRKSATGASIFVCVEKTNTAYTGPLAKGCSYFVVSSTTNLDVLPATTDTLTCGGTAFTAPTSGSCASGSTKITVKVSGSSSDQCVQNTNPNYLAESTKGCAFYTVTSTTASDDMVCGGATFTSSCTAGVQTSIPLRTSAGGTSINYCVKNINPAFLAAGPNCQFYLVSSTTSSDTLDCSGVGSLTALESGACPTGKVLLTIKDSSGASTQACYPESDGLYAVQNCESYFVTVTGTNAFPTLPLNTTTLTCTCSSTLTTQSLKSLVGTSRKACIPNTQWRVNCDTYTKKSVGQYSCSACQQGANLIVPLGKGSANGNAKNYNDACVPAKVPGCQTYKIYLTTATAFDGAGTAYDNAVGCVTCSSGYATLSAGATTFLFWSTTTNTVGKACPADGTISTTDCSEVKLVNGAYSCNTCSGANTFKTTYYNSASQLTVGCLKSGTSSTAFYKNMDTNCELFSWGNADLHTDFTCTRCKSGYVLRTVYDSDGTTTYKRCVLSTTFITSNCKDLIAADLTIASPVYVCFKCVTGYTQLNVAVVTGSIYSVLCAKTGRFSLISPCTKYDPTMNLDLVFGLTCSVCSSGTIPSCTATCTASVGGFTAKNSQTTPADICVKTNFVDNCAQYATTAASSGSGNTGDNDCVKCAAGFSNVTTSATTLTGGKAIICISDTQKIANCNIYNHADLACYECKEKLGFDRNTWKCRGPTDVSASCTKGVMVGDKLVCITCPIGYTLKDGACVTAVPFCASLSSTGVCSACVQPNNYQLINNKCILKPANCATVNENGACTVCKQGFLLTVDNSCAVTSSNTCPAGQFLSNGVCVTGTIANCQTYDKNGKCDTCKSGFTLSTNGKQCTVSSSGSSSRYPNAPPCPADTNKFRYVRNPSDPNGPCVPVDVQCANPRDDGHCISCKDGEFAHTDGLCYKIVFPSN